MKKQVLNQLSVEQALFVNKALLGENILVDACIGSGKQLQFNTCVMHFRKQRKSSI